MIEDVLERNFSIPAPTTEITPSSLQEKPAQLVHDPMVDHSNYFAEGTLNQFLFNEYDFFGNQMQDPML